eukprot:6023215-Amphidinium_carterae.2
MNELTKAFINMNFKIRLFSQAAPSSLTFPAGTAADPADQRTSGPADTADPADPPADHQRTSAPADAADQRSEPSGPSD